MIHSRVFEGHEQVVGFMKEYGLRPADVNIVCVELRGCSSQRTSFTSDGSHTLEMNVVKFVVFYDDSDCWKSAIPKKDTVKFWVLEKVIFSVKFAKI